MKKLLPLFLLIAISLKITAQEHCPFQLLSKPEDINAKKPEEIKKIERARNSNQVIVTGCDNKKKVIDNKLLWGYQEKNKTIFRNCFNDFLQVEAITDSIIIYSKTGKGYLERTITTHYFSRNLHSPVLLLNKENFYNQFKGNTCLLGKVRKEFMLTSNLAQWDNKSSTFKIIKIIKECRTQ